MAEKDKNLEDEENEIIDVVEVDNQDVATTDNKQKEKNTNQFFLPSTNSRSLI